MWIFLYICCTALLHLAVFISYPKTGPLGALFVLISILVWGAGFIIMSTMAGIKPSTARFANTAALLAALLSALFLLPQLDGVSVFDKLSLGIYPNRASVYEGLKRVGLDYPELKPPEKQQELIEL